MKKRTQKPSGTSKPSTSKGHDVSKMVQEENKTDKVGITKMRRSGLVWLTLFALITYCAWSVHYYQFQSLPAPLSSEQVGKRGFSELEAMKHVKALTELGPHPVASDALDLALQYVLEAAEKIKESAHWEVEVEVDFFHAKSGANSLVSGLFMGKTLVYSDLKHIILRIFPKYLSEATEKAILVSSHIDTVFSTEGAGDCSSCVSVMLELARGVSQWAHGFKNSVIFLFNTGEEEGLNGAHSFITQHPWSSTVRMAVDLEAMGVGGKSVIFQAGPHPWAIEKFASVAKYPSGQIIAQDLFTSGAIKSATDFQIYKEVTGLSGLDFAYLDNTAVYHTKNDKLSLLKSGSLQHLGDNMLAFLLHIGSSSHIPKGNSVEEDKFNHGSAIYFDILGQYMIVYHKHFAKMLQNSVILQSVLIWTTSLVMGGYPATVSLALSCLSIFLMWIFSVGFSVIVAFILPLISSLPLPYVASPWLVVGLFVSPALLGALTGQHLGYFILQAYLSSVYSKREKLAEVVLADLVKLEAERWLFKAGFVQWFVLLTVGTYYEIGSSYMALVWLLSPAFAYGLLEATLTPVRFPRPLKLATLVMGLAVPILISSGIFIQLSGTVIGMVVRFDRNPGVTPEWMGNAIVAVFIASIICLTGVYLLSYAHLSGTKRSTVAALCMMLGLSLAMVSSGIVPSFTEDTARAVNVVHVVDSTWKSGEKQNPSSFVSLFSNSPGKLTKEVEEIKEGLICGRDKVVDFVTFSVKYGCLTYDDAESGWTESDIPKMHVYSDTKGDARVTQVSIDTKGSTRWTLAINTDEIEDFSFEENMEVLVPLGNKVGVDGWHIIQFSGGKNAPTSFGLKLIWASTSTRQSHKVVGEREDNRPLLKLRTDFNRVTPKAERVLAKLPRWCSLFGKSTSPFTLAFLTSLHVDN